MLKFIKCVKIKQMQEFIVACVTPKPISDLLFFLRYLKEAGVKKVVLLGSTGEGVGLFPQDYKDILEIARNVDLEYIVGIANPNPEKVKQIIDVCEECLSVVHQKTQYVKDKQKSAYISGYMISPPFTTKPRQADIIAYYKEFATKPVVIYNNIARFGVNITFDTYKQLLKDCNIVGIKECAAPNDAIWQQLRNWINELIMSQSEHEFTERVMLYAGDDENWDTLRNVKGSSDLDAKSAIDQSMVDGCISVVGNVIPEVGVALSKDLSSEEDKKIYLNNLDEWLQMCQIFKITPAIPNPMHVKYLLYKKGLIKSDTFLKFDALNDVQKQALDLLLD